MLYCFFFFFFSSRRRHTRFDCDWSSDVCSSDLLEFYASAVNFDPAAPMFPVSFPGDYVKELSEQLGLFSDRKSTRLNSSHSQISYAVFCLKKKKKTNKNTTTTLSTMMSSNGVVA